MSENSSAATRRFVFTFAACLAVLTAANFVLALVRHIPFEPSWPMYITMSLAGAVGDMYGVSRGYKRA